ncbi:MAG: DNA polymerase I [Spirochaetaceae bacterium]|jgi:DNA polymerase-1|nr:DNA polymerase I [Spirochaetaceae bacterium]
MPPPLYLIDAYGLIYRFYFAFLSRPLQNSRGQNVSALFGFARTLTALIDEGAPVMAADGTVQVQKPLRLAAAFDSRVPTFRHKLYAEYKATRQKAPDDLHSQVPLVEEVLAALGIPALRTNGYEADDIIATLAMRCRAEGRDCYILSSDKDLLQLVGDADKGSGAVYQLRPQKAGVAREANTGAAGTIAGLPYSLTGPAEVKAEWGVLPERVLDLLSLTGDSSDNVPGVKGVGEKTAIKLMARYGSLDGIYKNIAGIEGAVGKKLAEGKESAYFARKLITLETAVPLPIKSVDELSIENINRSAGAAVLMREGIQQSARQLDPKVKADASSPASNYDAAHTGAGGGVTGNATDDGSGSRNLPPDPSLLGEGTYKIILDEKELAALLQAARKQGLLALDFETDSLDAWNARPIGISLALRPKEAYYVPVAAHNNPEGPAPFIDPGKVRSLLIPLLSDSRMIVAAHNAKYDYKVSRGWGVERWKCRIWDTMVAAWVDDPQRLNYNLDSLASYYFNYEPIPYDTVVPKGGTFDDVPLETACRYSAEDADLTLRLMRFLGPRLENADSLKLFLELEMPLLPVLAEMEGEGIRIETKTLTNYGVELSEEMNKVQDQAWAMVGHEFNLGSPKQLQEVLFTERHLTPTKKIKTGYSTDVDVLEELARRDPVPALILRHRTLSKLKSTYIDGLVNLGDKNGRIHTSFIQTGTATGRLSSREPNLQNIPIREEEGRRIREAFVAKSGHVLISADYSQIELVVLTHLSQDENLMAAFRDGVDVHARTAALIFGLPENDIPADKRRIAKTINFGVMYGMSAFRLSNELKISRTEAAAFINAYFATYAGVSRFIQQLIKQTEETGYVSTILGRRRYIPAINSRNKTEKAAAERVAVNTPIQGSAADIVKTAMLKLDKKLADSPARLLLQVHDELILECPKDLAAETARLVQHEMENAVPLMIPLRVSVETGKCWGKFH